MPALEWRDSTRSEYRKYIVRPDDVSLQRCAYHRGQARRKSGACWTSKMFPAARQHNRKAFGLRFRPVAGRGERARKNKIEMKFEDTRSDLESRRLTADDREWNRVFRHRSIDRPEIPDRFANAPTSVR